jgi:hypothetical protein
MSNIISQAIYNKARVDKFILSMTTPKCFEDIETKTERPTHHKSYQKVIPDKMQFSVYGGIVPDISVPSIDVPQYGQTLKVSSHSRPAYSDITVNFGIDNEYNNYWYIWRWLDIMSSARYAEYDKHEQGSSRDVAGYVTEDDTIGPALGLDYMTDMTLFGLDEYNKQTIQFEYIHAFPVSLGEISFNHQSSDEITSSFSFAFTQLLVNLL